MANSNPNQFILPFGAGQSELLAQINLLRDVETELTPARQDRVIELLERLTLLGNDLTERAGRVSVRAQVIAIAARIKTRSSYSDRSVREWCKWAIELGVLSVAVRSHVYGRREWNLYQINVDRIRELIAAGSIGMAGSGRKWPEVTAAPRAEVTAAPRAEVTAAPRAEVTAAPSNSSLNRRNNSNHPQPAEELPAELSGLVVVVSSLGVVRASEALAKALAMGLDRNSIQERLEHFRSLPAREQTPGKLYNWLAIPRSFGRETSAKLELAPGLDPADERDRADLIRHGRKHGWELARLQHAVRRFEAERLPQAQGTPI